MLIPESLKIPADNDFCRKIGGLSFLSVMLSVSCAELFWKIIWQRENINVDYNSNSMIKGFVLKNSHNKLKVSAFSQMTHSKITRRRIKKREIIPMVEFSYVDAVLMSTTVTFKTTLFTVSASTFGELDITPVDLSITK